MALTSGTRAAALGPRGLASMLCWRRVAFTLTLSTLIGPALSIHQEGRRAMDSSSRSATLS